MSPAKIARIRRASAHGSYPATFAALLAILPPAAHALPAGAIAATLDAIAASWAVSKASALQEAAGEGALWVGAQRYEVRPDGA